jgi:hypothetical protein
MSDEAACEKCGANSLEMIVHCGSYVLTCRACGEGWATSFIAVAPHLIGQYRAAIIDDDWREIEPVGQGSGPDFMATVRRAAQSGRVLLTPLGS